MGLICLIALIIGIAISWLITIGLVYLICLCFDLIFSLAVATGIWLVLFILKAIFTK